MQHSRCFHFSVVIYLLSGMPTSVCEEDDNYLLFGVGENTLQFLGLIPTSSVGIP